MHGDDLKLISLFSYLFFSLLHSYCLSLPQSPISLLPSSSFSFLISYFIVMNFYLKCSVFCDVTPCSPENTNRRVRETYRFHLQGWSWRSRSSETSVNFRWTTRHYITEDINLHNQRCGNLKCYIYYSPPFFFLSLLLFSLFFSYFFRLRHVILPLLHILTHTGNIAADSCCPAEPADKGLTLNEAPFRRLFT